MVVVASGEAGMFEAAAKILGQPCGCDLVIRDEQISVFLFITSATRETPLRTLHASHF